MTELLASLLFVAVVGLVILASRLLTLRKRTTQLDSELQHQRTRYEHDQKQWSDRATALERENQRLSKWQSVADADTKAAEMIQSAQARLDEATSDASSLISRAQQEADALLAGASNQASAIALEARQEAKKHKDEARAVLDSATIQAGTIVDAANKRAQEIAGSAYEAMNNATLYEQTVKAMKNIIEGYGDQYIIPSQSLLDDLAEEFGYTEAGGELKKARERSKYMIRNGTAATCEYVETNRRTTAISFVIDAFNGKVDSILSRVRHDNAGTLEQEVRDAFTLVNFNGKAFRKARITEGYLGARIAELKWAATAQQLKMDEREEQRRIKEQIREEEKARKEYERAIRDAAKEEELLRKAMEKAQQQIEQAGAEQKAEYEQQLQELTEKLRQAEERNQRAISMAQQTKRGHVYIISNIGSFGENVYKIGLTRRLEPLDRVRELGDSSVPFEFDVHALIFSEDAPGLEGQLQNHFLMMQMNKVNYRKEFFRVDLKQIREEAERLGLAARWTMTAEAREYHETLAVEKAIKDNPAMREAWIHRQLELEAVGSGVGQALESIAE
jgi:hypothetical protein